MPNTVGRKFETSLAIGLMLLTFIVGCNRPRSYYRIQADKEVNSLVDSKAAVVDSEPGRFRIGIDPRSRMYDPNRPRLRADAARRSGLKPNYAVCRLQEGVKMLALPAKNPLRREPVLG